MEIRQLRAFLAIAEAKTFTAGARQVNITQAAISMQIRQLEDEVGLQLFTRTPRRVILTEAGESLINRARKILREHDAAVAEIAELAGAEYGRLRIGSAGNGSTIHLAGEMFKSMAGIDITLISYKGSGPAMTALLGNEIQLLFAPTGTSLPQVNAGKVRAIGVSSIKRSKVMPGIPTLAESGLPGFEVSGWYGLLAPAKTPRPVIDKLYAESRKALDTDSMRERLSANSLEPLALTPEQSAQFIKADIARWSRVIREANIVKE